MVRASPRLIVCVNSLVVILADIEFFNQHYEDFKTWCDHRGCIIKGMTVTVPDPETLTLFALKFGA